MLFENVELQGHSPWYLTLLNIGGESLASITLNVMVACEVFPPPSLATTVAMWPMKKSRREVEKNHDKAQHVKLTFNSFSVQQGAVSHPNLSRDGVKRKALCNDIISRQLSVLDNPKFARIKILGRHL